MKASLTPPFRRLLAEEKREEGPGDGCGREVGSEPCVGACECEGECCAVPATAVGSEGPTVRSPSRESSREGGTVREGEPAQKRVREGV